MKTIITLITLFFATISMHAQDTLKMKNGIKIIGVVTEISDSQIKFKKTADGPIYTIQKADVNSIAYQNGTTEVVNSTVTSNSSTPESAKAKKDEDDEKLDPAKHYGGPRIGFTILGDGTSNDRLNEAWNRKVNPVISQFGWQFESRIFTLKDGSTGLVEFIPMIGGLEQGLFLPSASALMGFRSHNGFELGMGPTLSMGGPGLIFAAGASYKVGKVTFPVNIAFSPSIAKTTLPSTQYTYDSNGNQIQQQIPSVTTHSGFRVSLLVGFNSRKD